MTGPGAPRRGRHASPEDEVALPPTAWIPAPARGLDDGTSDRWDAGAHDWAAPTAEWPLPQGTLTAASWAAPSWDDTAEEIAAGDIPAEDVAAAGHSYWTAGGPAPVGARTAERSYDLGSPDGLPPVPQAASGLLALRAPAALPEWRHRSGGDGEPAHPARAPHADDLPSGSAPAPGGSGATGSGPDGGGAPLPPMPSSAWSRLRSRPGDGSDTAPGASVEDTISSDPVHDWDGTGGLDVIGAHVEDPHDEDPHDEEPVRRGGLFRRSRRAAAPAAPGRLSDGVPPAGDDTDVHERYGPVDGEHPADEHGHQQLDVHDEQYLDEHFDEHFDGHHEPAGLLPDEDIPVAPFDGRARRGRRRRRRVALVVALVVMAALIGGVVVGGRKVLDLVNPPDYSGQGTGSVRVRVNDGDTLKVVGQTMVNEGVIASVRPFTDAAKDDPRATSLAPGVYGLHSHMSAKAALDLLLDPKSRLTSRVTIPEGLTVAQTLQRIADGTGTPVAALTAAAADPAAIGLPAYAGGKVEGFLFPATYDFEPGTTPTQMLAAMVTRGTQALDDLAIPEAQRLQTLTLASIVQAEAASADDMAKVARVLDNRLAIGMPLQLDTTVNYANGKNGLTTTDQDRANPSPYNTYVHPGLPPGPISNPGEQALRAVLAPAQGNWLYFVVIDPDTGETRFATTADEHAKNVLLFQQWLKAHPGR